MNSQRQSQSYKGKMKSEAETVRKSGEALALSLSYNTTLL